MTGDVWKHTEADQVDWKLSTVLWLFCRSVLDCWSYKGVFVIFDSIVFMYTLSLYILLVVTILYCFRKIPGNLTVRLGIIIELTSDQKVNIYNVWSSRGSNFIV